MSPFVYALALFPALATVIVAVVALADRHEAIALNALRAIEGQTLEDANGPSATTTQNQAA